MNTESSQLPCFQPTLGREPAALQQRRQKLSADPGAPAVGGDVDRILDGEPVGRPRAVGVDVGVAGDGAVQFGDQVGETLGEHVGAAAGHFRHVWRIVLEACGAGSHGVAVDGGDGRQVGLGAVSDDQGHA
jgi:hypothetical protein